MQYGLEHACGTTNNHRTIGDGDYHARPYPQHYNHHSEHNSSYHSNNYSSGFDGSYSFNGHHKFDTQDEQQLFDEVDDGDEHEIKADRPKLLMWGLTKSGKTSIIKLIFEKMTAGETLQLPETKIVQVHELTCGIHIRFQIRDVPGPKTAITSEFDDYASNCTTVIFVLDATEDDGEAINLLVRSVQSMYSNDRHVRFEVLIHKIDGIHEHDRHDKCSAIQQKVRVMLHEFCVEEPLINFYLTSIYDHSTHEAFSKIVQNQMRQLRDLENMLDVAMANTQLDKIFVCDIYNKIFLASDTKPVESQISELCCDVVDVYTDISSIYGTNNSPVLDSMSHCTIELSIGLVLYLKDINPTTALICILKKESKRNGAFMEVNLNILKENIQELFLANGAYSNRPAVNASTVE